MIQTIKNIRIEGISNCVPSRSVSNEDYDLIGETERKLLIKTTGIKSRRVANEGTCASDLCYEAAEKLIKDLNWNKNDIDLLIFVSQSSDYYLPATSIILQNRLNLNSTTLAFDINLGCSGYVYGLNVIGSMLSSGQLKKALLLCGDISTNATNIKDKSSYPLFGDSGSATAISYDNEASDMIFSMGSDGKGANSIIIKGGYGREKYHEDSLKEFQISEGITRHELNIILDGLEIFNFSVQTVPSNIKELLNSQNKSIENVDYFVFHQANKIINETIRKKLKINPENCPYSIEEYGNTSSGSIPLTINTALQKQLQENRSTLLLSGFGVGLSWGSVLLETDRIIISDLIELQ
ncbi:MAG: ketoacyl-ACP synthase III [Flavobacteriales bacterium]|nr:ketoacyl-ACP synthase III [Flavobacteriales bacterium]